MENLKANRAKGCQFSFSLQNFSLTMHNENFPDKKKNASSYIDEKRTQGCIVWSIDVCKTFNKTRMNATRSAQWQHEMLHNMKLDIAFDI